jgi:ABC-type dipeptide/oligopeptide/nickel transport system ATPase component
MKTKLLFFLCLLNSFAQPKLIPHFNKSITYQGRIEFNDKYAILNWSGSSIKIRFKGTEIAGVFQDADTSNHYNVLIDNQLYKRINLQKAKKTYVLASNLKNKIHTVEVFKRTEWEYGKTFFYGFEVPKTTKILAPSKLPKRKIEFFGNSITCGLSSEDLKADSQIGYYENNYNSYAYLTAQHFNAQYHATAKSGIGITVSWFPMIMPEMYDRLDPRDENSKWDFTRYTPDLVVINLFQNDSWLVNMPNHEQFKARFGTTKPTEDFLIKSYKEFVQKVREKYPNAQIICMLGNMEITKEGSPWPEYVKKAVAQINDKKIYTFFQPFKNAPNHPKVKEQKIMAQGLIQFIEKNIKW